MLKNRLFSVFVLCILCACQPAEQQKSKKTEMGSALQVSIGEPVKPSEILSFPQDHGIHNKQGIEWWYLTANLKTANNETFGVQWTLFRTLMPSKANSQWWDNNLYFAHFAMQNKQEHVAFERFARVGQASVTSSPFNASIDNWQLKSNENTFLPLTLSAEQEGYAVELTLAQSPLTLHGDNGYSQKTQSGHASYYYSYPFLNVTGKLTFAGNHYNVTGNAWYDREWSASLLDKQQRGWDWFSLVDSQSGDKKGLMLFCIRGDDQGYDYCSGSKISANGKVTQIPQQDITLTVINTVSLGNRDYPSKWQVQLANSEAIIIESITKDSRNQLSIEYWEGRVKATGGFNGKGYAELTGY